jgi:hypothetical protein
MENDQKPRRKTILDALASDHYATLYECGDRILSEEADIARKLRDAGKSPKEIAKVLGLGRDPHYVAALLAVRRR